jgi:predicted naringenin-chalcone synthase
VGREIRTRLLDEVGPVLAGLGVDDPILFHPGGVALMALMREAYPSLRETVDLATEVIAHHGNLGAPSLLWVLAEALARRAPVSPNLRLFALGAGIVTTIATLHDAVIEPGAGRGAAS